MRKDLIGGVVAMVLFTLLCGVAYPLVITGVSQVVYPHRADGQLVRDASGEVIGSRLIGRHFTARDQFQGRPSATGYSPSATFFSNRAPNSAAARVFYRDELREYVRRNAPYVPGLTASRVPVDAVTTSASGVDPDISPANARIQAHRIAALRRLPLARVDALVHDATHGRFLGVLGEPGVNVDDLNTALNREAHR